MGVLDAVVIGDMAKATENTEQRRNIVSISDRSTKRIPSCPESSVNDARKIVIDQFVGTCSISFQGGYLGHSVEIEKDEAGLKSIKYGDKRKTTLTRNPDTTWQLTDTDIDPKTGKTIEIGKTKVTKVEALADGGISWIDFQTDDQVIVKPDSITRIPNDKGPFMKTTHRADGVIEIGDSRAGLYLVIDPNATYTLDGVKITGPLGTLKYPNGDMAYGPIDPRTLELAKKSPLIGIKEDDTGIHFTWSSGVS
jgi:hypothetical protein